MEGAWWFWYGGLDLGDRVVVVITVVIVPHIETKATRAVRPLELSYSIQPVKQRQGRRRRNVDRRTLPATHHDNLIGSHC